MLKVIKDNLIKNTWQLSQNEVIIGSIQLKNNGCFLFRPTVVYLDASQLRAIMNALTNLELSKFYGVIDG